MANSESNAESSQIIENSEQYVSTNEKQETRNLLSADPKRHSIPKYFKIE
jgi:hypothetical protein